MFISQRVPKDELCPNNDKGEINNCKANNNLLAISLYCFLFSVDGGGLIIVWDRQIWLKNQLVHRKFDFSGKMLDISCTLQKYIANEMIFGGETMEIQYRNELVDLDQSIIESSLGLSKKKDADGKISQIEFEYYSFSCPQTGKYFAVMKDNFIQYYDCLSLKCQKIENVNILILTNQKQCTKLKILITTNFSIYVFQELKQQSYVLN